MKLFALRRMGWPGLAGFVATLLAAGILLGGKKYEEQSILASAAQLRQVQDRINALEARASIASPTFAYVQPPGDEDFYSSDFVRVTGGFRKHALVSTRTSYGREAVPELRIIVRTVELQFTDDYPKVREALVESIRTTPHAFIETLRFEKGGGPDEKVQVLVKLSLVYDSN
jgi:hypothetical protein